MTGRCEACGKLFINGDKKTKYNNFEYHQDCFCCSTCRQAIQQSFFNLPNGQYRCLDCQKQFDVKIQCIQCQEPIDEEAYIEYKGEAIHARCFSCRACAQPLGNMLYVEHDNEPYCVNCHMDHFAQSCAICARPFPPGISTRRCDNRFYHIECFRCFHCGKIILNKNYSINEEQQRICEICS